MGGIFGSKPKQKSGNLAYPFVSSTFGPLTAQAVTGTKALQALLGGDPTGFNKYKEATGFNAAAEEGARGITGSAAARGLLRSGSTGKALQSFGTRLQDQFAGNYMDRLLQQSNLGLSAGNLISSAGQYGSGSGGGKSGLGNALGLGASIIASDRRLKKNIKKLSEYEDGLGIYQYHYIDGSGPHIGVMADEVERLRPEALGPVIDGYMTVDYSKLEVVNG